MGPMQTDLIVRKSVIGSNIHIEVNEFNSLCSVFVNDSRHFGFSTRSLAPASWEMPRKQELDF